MKKLPFLLIALCFCLPLIGQSYFTAAGIRLGSDWGITVQQKIAKKVTIEGILQNGFNNDNTTVSLLLEKHNSLIGKRLNFYYGAGMHRTWLPDTDPVSAPNNPYGLSLVAGAEFTLGRLNLGFDYKPLINLAGDGKQFQSQGGLSLRYVLVKKVKTNNKSDDWKFWERDKKKKNKKKKKKKKRGGLFS